MGDVGFYTQGAVGPARVRREIELDPYDTNYFGTEIGLGIDFPDGYQLLPGVSREWARVSLLTELRYGFVGGSDVNRGSCRHAVDLNLGLRLRLLKLLVLDGGVGGGYARTTFDFGKGFPVETAHNAVVQIHAGVGIEWCIGGVCLTPFAQFTHEMGLVGERYILQALYGGVRVGSRPEEDVRPAAAEKALPPTDDGPICPPTPECPKCVCPQFEQSLLQRLHWPDQIYFPNDNPELDLRKQWFHAQGDEAFRCLSSPSLDVYIRALWKWTKALGRGRLGIREAVTFIVHVTGYANDTGELARQQCLATARGVNVMDYLTVSHGMTGCPHGTRSAQPTCGAQDEYGRASKTLQPLIEQGYVRIEHHAVAGNPADQIRRDFGPEADPRDPKYRMVQMRLEVALDGRVLPVDKALDLIADLERVP